ncbi:MAG: hypothetical protein H5U02_00530 [Clostridia bacterium]|nr:hypothetical protein [Clostridia bacterium]
MQDPKVTAADVAMILVLGAKNWSRRPVAVEPAELGEREATMVVRVGGQEFLLRITAKEEAGE